MKIEEVLHLFVKVSEGFPEENDTACLTIIDGIISVDFYKTDGGFFKGTTHWLDLSKLTTKEKAIELAQDASVSSLGYKYVEENKHNL
jgi:hypothetical protein